MEIRRNEMKQLIFIISGQTLTRTDELEIVSDAIGQFEAVFTFDEWWDGFTPTAQFTKDGKTIDCILDNDKCVVPPEVLQGGGIFYVNVFSTDGTGDRKTVNEVAVPLKTSGYKKDGSHSQKPTPTVYEQLLEKLSGNTEMNDDGIVTSPNADFAEVAEWADGNPNNEDRTGYFVCANVPIDGIVMKKATSVDDVKGVTIRNPAFVGNYTKDKVDVNGKLLPTYSYVAIIGFVPVIDNGTCTVGGRCMPDDNGCAIPSSNSMGYQVVNRIDENRVLIIIEPNGDMVQRIKTKIIDLQKLIDEIELSGGGTIIVDNKMSDTSTNPVQNKTVYAFVNAIAEQAVRLIDEKDYEIRKDLENSLVEFANNVVIKQQGKGLSTNDFTNDYKTKVDNSASTKYVDDVETNLKLYVDSVIGGIENGSY